MVLRALRTSSRQAGWLAHLSNELHGSVYDAWLTCLDRQIGTYRGAWAALQRRGFAKKRQHRNSKKSKLHGSSTWPKVDREKWHKDLSLDLVVEKERSTLHVLAMKDILANLPGMQMPMAKLAAYKRFIGLVGDRSRPAAWLARHPTIFEVHDNASAHPYITFTPEAAEHVAKEQQFWAENEGLLVQKVRKILMMAPERRLSLDVLAQLKRPIGLPDDFKVNMVFNYPQYFRVVEATNGAELELVEWDAELAVSSFDKILASRPPPPPDEEKPGLSKNGSSSNWVYWSSFRNKANLTRKHVQEIIEFHQSPPVSPYFDRAHELAPQSVEAEKHAVAVLHELLSLTLRKRIVIDHLAHYRKFFRYTKPTRSIFIRHPELFYVSLKTATETVFLRDAYSACELLVEDPFLKAQSWVSSMNESRMFAKRLEKERLKELRRNQNKVAKSYFAEPEANDKPVVAAKSRGGGDGTGDGNGELREVDFESSDEQDVSDGEEDGSDAEENFSSGDDEEIISDGEFGEAAAENDVDTLSCQEGGPAESAQVKGLSAK